VRFVLTDVLVLVLCFVLVECSVNVEIDRLRDTSEVENMVVGMMLRQLQAELMALLSTDAVFRQAGGVARSRLPRTVNVTEVETDVAVISTAEGVFVLVVFVVVF
jgi:hypothetical protein